jgi:predicted GIY-YIG superfamily endonuclease
MAGGYVYILASAPDGILHIGVTSDLVRRIYEHRNGLVPGFTKTYGIKRLPVAPQKCRLRPCIASRLPEWRAFGKVMLSYT